jgi:hypothetical protein
MYRHPQPATINYNVICSDRINNGHNELQCGHILCESEQCEFEIARYEKY